MYFSLCTFSHITAIVFPYIRHTSTLILSFFKLSQLCSCITLTRFVRIHPEFLSRRIYIIYKDDTNQLLMYLRFNGAGKQPEAMTERQGDRETATRSLVMCLMLLLMPRRERVGSLKQSSILFCSIERFLRNFYFYVGCLLLLSVCCCCCRVVAVVGLLLLLSVSGTEPKA